MADEKKNEILSTKASPPELKKKGNPKGDLDDYIFRFEQVKICSEK